MNHIHLKEQFWGEKAVSYKSKKDQFEILIIKNIFNIEI